MRRAFFGSRSFLLVFVLVLGVQPARSWAQQQSAAAPTAQEKPLSFEVASIKPSNAGLGRRSWHSDDDRLTISGFNLRDLILQAYGLKSDSQVIGGPVWLAKDRFDIAAKIDEADMAKQKTMSPGEEREAGRQRVQSLLAERFGLVVTRDRRTLPVLDLVVARGSQQLAPADKTKSGSSLSVDNAHLEATNVSMTDFAGFLTRQDETGGRVVVDRTGLAGGYNFKLDWTADHGNGVPPDAPSPGLFTALREQLGLELKPGKASVDVVVVQSAKEPEFD